MFNRKQTGTFYILAFTLFLCLHANAQQRKAQNPLDDSDLLIYKAPSEKYHNIVLQKHKGLPRLGVWNGYRKPGVRKLDQATNNKVKRVGQGYRNYYSMLKLKLLSDTYGNLNKKKPTTVVEKEKTEKDAQSYIIQQLLNNLLNTICVEESCSNAFRGNNEFERLRNYQNFISENWEPLKNWAGTFFKDNSLTAYEVGYLSLTSYDFEKNGYWINIRLSSGVHGNSPFFKIFEPKSVYEKELVKQLEVPRPGRAQNMTAFFPLSPAKAETLVTENIRNLYLVKKVKVVIKKGQLIAGRVPHDYVYHHESPTLEIYKDAALTKKLGEISLDKLIIKDK